MFGGYRKKGFVRRLCGWQPSEVEIGKRVVQENFIERASKLLNVDFNDVSMVVTDEALMEERKEEKAKEKEKKKVSPKTLGETSAVWTEAFFFSIKESKCL